MGNEENIPITKPLFLNVLAHKKDTKTAEMILTAYEAYSRYFKSKSSFSKINVIKK